MASNLSRAAWWSPPAVGGRGQVRAGTAGADAARPGCAGKEIPGALPRGAPGTPGWPPGDGPSAEGTGGRPAAHAEDDAADAGRSAVAIDRALSALLAAFPVYRTYAEDGGRGETDHDVQAHRQQDRQSSGAAPVFFTAAPAARLFKFGQLAHRPASFLS